MEMSRTRLEQRGAAQGLRCLLVACATLLVAAPLLMAAPASAARVVEVRMGQHPGYSRLVFELDVAAGYKVERHAPTDGVQELVVSLDASADSQTLSRELDFIESVEIESITSRRSLVRIRLKGDNLRLKESMLANPPRIVLDILSEAAIAKARAAEKVSAKQELARAEAEKMASAVALSAPKPAANPAVEATAPKPGSVEKAATRREAPTP